MITTQEASQVSDIANNRIRESQKGGLRDTFKYQHLHCVSDAIRDGLVGNQSAFNLLRGTLWYSFSNTKAPASCLKASWI